MTRVISPNRYVGRLAPAPTGALHLGNARTFLVAWLRARRAGGRLILRLEDLDHPKVKPEAAADCYRDLAWLGLDWDEGPAASFGRPERGDDPCVQSRNLEYYRGILERWRREGRVYPCVCARRDLENLQSAPNAGEDLAERRYSGACRGRFADAGEAVRLSGREPAWRFRIDDAAETRFVDGFSGDRISRLGEWSGDFVVARGDRPGYQLAVVADDARQGVSEVVRGDDLLPSTHRQLLLYHALGVEAPAFYHVPLVVGPDGRRLAKRHGDSRLGELRRRGLGPERVLGWLAWSCGWLAAAREASLAEIAVAADFSRMPRTRVVAGSDALRWIGFPAR